MPVQLGKIFIGVGIIVTTTITACFAKENHRMYSSFSCRSNARNALSFLSSPHPLLRHKRIPRRCLYQTRPKMALAAVDNIGISRLQFASTFTEKLPSDPNLEIEVRQVFNAAYSFVKPSDPTLEDVQDVWKAALERGEVQSGERGESSPERALIAWSSDCAKLFDLDDGFPGGDDYESIIKVLGGFGELWPGMKPYAMCYGGHQFGSWAGQLGDGRAISLGEYVNKKGERWEIQLKGAGKTPYSRFADGRAVLRSSVREFLCSEAMHHLGIPTTRALSLVGTGTGVIRDMFYTGNPQMEPGAVVARIAPTFLRLGNFQLATFRDDKELLKQLADYAIEHHFPELRDLPEDKPGEAGKYSKLVEEVMKRNAKMVALWQGVGFVHGVMNTDNFSILGLTIDYGPYGFLDEYDPNYTPNTTDMPGRRYKFEMQSTVAHWNMLMFAKAMVPLCGSEEMQRVVQSFPDVYDGEHSALMAKKLGLSNLDTKERKEILSEFQETMAESKADHTNTWRALSSLSAESTEQEMSSWIDNLSLKETEKSAELWSGWLMKYKAVLEDDKSKLDAQERVDMMNKTNPVYILRNYMAQIAIEKAEKGDYDEVRRLYSLLRNPFVVQNGMEEYTKEPPSWAAKPGVCVNSCSS